MHARISALLAAFALAFASLAYAQDTTTGTIAGRIVDAQGLAVPGVTVTVTGPQGVRTTVTDAEGRFNAPFLTPGVYTVRAELQGFRTTEQRNVIVSLGQRVDLNVRMDVGALTETVEVTASSPIIDTRSTTAGAIISSDLLTRVPVGRRLSDTLYIAPGVSTSGNTGAMGRANPSIAGGSGLENQYVVDGGGTRPRSSRPRAPPCGRSATWTATAGSRATRRKGRSSSGPRSGSTPRSSAIRPRVTWDRSASPHCSATTRRDSAS